MRKTAVDWFNKAEALWDEDAGKYTRPKKAIEYLDKAIKLNPDYAESYVSRGTAYALLGQYELAIEDCDAAIRLKPDYARSYFARGTVNTNRDKGEDAINDLNKAIQLKPDYAKAYYNRGIAYRKVGQYERAIDDCDEVIRIKPDYEAAQLNKTACLALQEIVIKKCNVLREAIERRLISWQNIKRNKEFDDIRNTTAFIELPKEEGQDPWLH